MDEKWKENIQYTPPDYDLAAFEDGDNLGKSAVEIQEISLLLECYQNTDSEEAQPEMPALMAEWMASKPVKKLIVSDSLSDFHTPWERVIGGPPKRGKGCNYNIPFERLAEFDCAIVFVTLGKDEVHRPSFSQQHQHPGDEIVFVLSGRPIIRLQNSGSRTELAPLDFVHFNAEIPHALFNYEKEPVELLILRFFQMPRQGTRQMQIDAMKALAIKIQEIAHKAPPPARLAECNQIEILGIAREIIESTERKFGELFQLWSKVDTWLSNRVRDPLDRLSFSPAAAPPRIRDYVALSAFLIRFIHSDQYSHRYDPTGNLQRLIRKKEAAHGRLSQSESRELDQNIRQLCSTIEMTFAEKADIQANQVYQCLMGRATEELFDGRIIQERLAAFFHFPSVLLEHVLIPPVQRYVIVRRDSKEQEMSTIARPRGESRGGGAKKPLPQYSIPCRALANSDVSIMFLSLKVGSCSDLNHHPGFEFLYVLTGEVKVELSVPMESAASDSIGKRKVIAEQKCGQRHYLCYRSWVEHQVINASTDVEAELLLIRFTVIDPLMEELLASGLLRGGAAPEANDDVFTS